MKTTLNLIRKNTPCPFGWAKLLNYLGKTKPDDEPLSITTIIDSNGLEDAVWCLRAVENREREIRLFFVWRLNQAQHSITRKRSIAEIDAVERFANGLATIEELVVIGGVAGTAAREADESAQEAQLRKICAECDAEECAQPVESKS